MLISSKATTKRCSERVGSNEDLHPTHFTIVSCRQKMAEQVFQYSTPVAAWIDIGSTAQTMAVEVSADDKKYQIAKSLVSKSSSSRKYLSCGEL
jgi:hypothetical protein